ncbi:hypothetical protein EJD96_00065 (plasmid) [Herbaspirillum seropedicae]|uniref:hypothetical protein n=1 Tax=Herbaspirillum seropedicae TaxID=964 RepID=UPI00111DDAEE|nr:hypothetical protein [Herbaspirillum seropedicae]QDD62648.1 hypothetical protein EJD96_00065 [Herbaspirillum seropedicae]
MSQYAFGSGNMYVTQLQDALGNAVVGATPYPLMTLQEGSIDISSDSKELYGQNQFPVAVGRGKAKLTGKVKPARIFAGVWNAIYFGQTVNAGLFANYTDTVGTVVPASPYTITAAPPNTGTFAADLGVIDANGNPMKRVASAPATGQYMVNVTTGVYTFASTDTGKLVYINFQYTAAVAGAQKQTVQNLPMGYAPAFKADLSVSYQGKIVTFSFLKAISTKFSMGFKNEDFAVPEFDFSGFDDGTGNVLTWSTSE